MEGEGWEPSFIESLCELLCYLRYTQSPFLGQIDTDHAELLCKAFENEYQIPPLVVSEDYHRYRAAASQRFRKNPNAPKAGVVISRDNLFFEKESVRGKVILCELFAHQQQLFNPENETLWADAKELAGLAWRKALQKARARQNQYNAELKVLTNKAAKYKVLQWGPLDILKERLKSIS